MIFYGITCCRGCEEKRKELSAGGRNCHMVCEEYLELSAKRKAAHDEHLKECDIDYAIKWQKRNSSQKKHRH